MFDILLGIYKAIKGNLSTGSIGDASFDIVKAGGRVVAVVLIYLVSITFTKSFKLMDENAKLTSENDALKTKVATCKP